MTKKRLFVVSVAMVAALLLGGCAAGANPTVDVLDENGDGAGLWSGLWHGVISPITFVIALFSDGVNIYDVFNNGNWYDFGFMFGISVIFGGGVRVPKRKSK